MQYIKFFAWHPIRFVLNVKKVWNFFLQNLFSILKRDVYECVCVFYYQINLIILAFKYDFVIVIVNWFVYIRLYP